MLGRLNGRLHGRLRFSLPFLADAYHQDNLPIVYIDATMRILRQTPRDHRKRPQERQAPRRLGDAQVSQEMLERAPIRYQMGGR